MSRRKAEDKEMSGMLSTKAQRRMGLEKLSDLRKKRACIFGHHIKIWQLSFFVKILLRGLKILNYVIFPGILTKEK